VQYLTYPCPTHSEIGGNLVVGQTLGPQPVRAVPSLTAGIIHTPSIPGQVSVEIAMASAMTHATVTAMMT
jgi:hypothetical protein